MLYTSLGACVNDERKTKKDTHRRVGGDGGKAMRYGTQILNHQLGGLHGTNFREHLPFWRRAEQEREKSLLPIAAQGGESTDLAPERADEEGDG